MVLVHLTHLIHILVSVEVRAAAVELLFILEELEHQIKVTQVVMVQEQQTLVQMLQVVVVEQVLLEQMV